MYKVVFSLIITVLVLITIGISVFQPKMHETVFIYDSSYELIEQKNTVEKIKVMPTQVINIPQQNTVKKLDEAVVSQQNSKPQVNTVKTVKKISTVNTIKTVEKPVARTVMQRETKVNSEVNTVKKTSYNSQPIAKTVTNPTKTVVETEKERQELILWNKWRSNLQNQIMSDTKLPIVPVGTIFKFSFNVDKYGKVSNVHTWSVNPTYTPYAIQYIAPVIRSYQGRSILNFPDGSNRISTLVEGGWKISNTSKFSTSSDYNDTEKVIK